MIRITGGNNRSRKLAIPETGLTKPTMDKVRAAVFSALNDDIDDKRVLDLFSGSGSYGFEALSRGASFVTFVDKQKEAVNVIKENGTALKETNYEIVRDDVLDYLGTKKEAFDIVFVDPPYKLEIYQNILDLLEKNDFLSSDSIIVLEADKELEINTSKFKKIKQYHYGTARIYILRK